MKSVGYGVISHNSILLADYPLTNVVVTFSGCFLDRSLLEIQIARPWQKLIAMSRVMALRMMHGDQKELTFQVPLKNLTADDLRLAAGTVLFEVMA